MKYKLKLYCSLLCILAVFLLSACSLPADQSVPAGVGSAEETKAAPSQTDAGQSCGGRNGVPGTAAVSAGHAGGTVLLEYGETAPAERGVIRSWQQGGKQKYVQKFPEEVYGTDVWGVRPGRGAACLLAGSSAAGVSQVQRMLTAQMEKDGKK